MDNELTLRAIAAIAEGVAQVIGKRGAHAVARQAGHHAVTRLLEWLPLQLSLDDALERAGLVLQELDFVSGFVFQRDQDLVRIERHAFANLLNGDDHLEHPVNFFLLGLYEGTVQKMSGQKIQATLAKTNSPSQVWRIDRVKAQ